MKAHFTPEQMRQRLEQECRAAGSQKAWAEAHGFSPAQVNDILKGKRSITAKFAKALGHHRLICFEPTA